MKRLVILTFLTGIGLWLYVFATSPSGDSAVVSVKQITDSTVIADSTSGKSELNVPESQCININIATVAELETLPGIGPVIAGRIVTYRSDNGPFSQLSEVDRVKGIGPAKLRKMAEYVCFE